MTFNFKTKSLTALILSFVLSNAANSANIAAVTISEQSIKISANEGYSNIGLTVSGPGGFYVQNFLGDGKVALVIDDMSSLSDGQYNYELTAASSSVSEDWQQNNGRGENSTKPAQSASQSGTFRVSNGLVITSTDRMNRRMIEEGGDQDEK